VTLDKCCWRFAICVTIKTYGGDSSGGPVPRSYNRWWNMACPRIMTACAPNWFVCHSINFMHDYCLLVMLTAIWPRINLLKTVYFNLQAMQKSSDGKIQRPKVTVIRLQLGSASSPCSSPSCISFWAKSMSTRVCWLVMNIHQCGQSGGRAMIGQFTWRELAMCREMHACLRLRRV
jgi:hypothetical protein